jgi:hypothetical protein
MRRPRLPVWFAAVILSDMVCSVLALAGIEVIAYSPGFTVHFPYQLVSAPFSHSLVGALGLSVLFAGGSFLLLRSFAVAAGLGLAVLSHFPLDWMVHGPDLAWAFEPPSLGLALWNRPWLAESLEVTILLAGTFLLLRNDPRISRRRVWVLTGILLVVSQFRTLLPEMPSQTVTAAPLSLAAAGLVIGIAHLCDRSADGSRVNSAQGT